MRRLRLAAANTCASTWKRSGLCKMREASREKIRRVARPSFGTRHRSGHCAGGCQHPTPHGTARGGALCQHNDFRGAYEMWLQGQPLTAVLVAFCAVIAPALYIMFMLTLLTAARRSSVPHWAGEMLRWVGHLQVWSMLEVVMLGILVALTKIAELATVEPGIGMYAFGAAILLIPAIMTNFDKRALWRKIAWNAGRTPISPPVNDGRAVGSP